MNGVHDLGGMHGFGRIVAQADEPVFRTQWERRVFGLVAAGLSTIMFNTDEFRYAIERMEPARYLSTSYYQHWLHALETLLLEKGILTAAELGAEPAIAEIHAKRATSVGRAAAGEHRPRRARFVRGDQVVALNLNPLGHTRLPRYVRGRPGTIARELGVFTFPDDNARGAGRNPQHCYTVCFKSRDLWGSSAGARERVYVDLWEDYLAPARTPTAQRPKRRKR